jgi:hypothetical protein
LVADDEASGRIRDKPDKVFNTADFYIGFISCEDISFLVGILIDKRFNTDGSCFKIVGNLLM